MNEFERILQAKKVEFHTELEGAVNDWNDTKEATTEAAHQQKVDALQADFQQKDLEASLGRAALNRRQVI